VSLFKRDACPLCHDKARKAKADAPYVGWLKCRACGLIFRPRGQGVN
jgi:hypothetical protein